MVERNASQNETKERYSRIAHALEADLLRYAMRLSGGDLDWAKDLVQDVLITGYTSFTRGELPDGPHARPWLLRVLTNRFINQYNRKRKWEAGLDVATLESEASGLIPSVAAGQEELVDSTLDEPLEAALNALPEDQRACVVLVDVEQLEYAEAAAILQIPIGTVRSRLARARLRLYTLLKPYAQARGIIS
ncbi:MAG TPA: RNA polymerase sigma factor [Fimbriimonas sp.]|nr:RNA polymerase sigma factor [Fimbriimonas sp.]